jgi:hypothetical protein
MNKDRTLEGPGSSTARVDMRLRLSRFALPPVQSALVIGKRAGIGSHAMIKALDEMMPGAFSRHEIEHSVIEAILIRDAHLRRIPAERLIPVLVRHAEAFMGDTDTLHFDVTVEVQVLESLEL